MPWYRCNISAQYKVLSQPGSQLWIQQCGRTTTQRVQQKEHFNSAQRQRYNRLHQQLPWIFNGSGALPNQGHLQATAVNNRQRTWSQNTGGSSTRHNKHLHTTMAASADDEVTALAATHKLKLKPQHMMATMPHMKNGKTSSQHTWAYRTHSSQGCLGWQKQQHNKWQRHSYDKQLQHWRKQKHGSNSIKASSMRWSTWQQEQQPPFAGNINMRLDSRYSDNSTWGLHCR